MRILHVNEQIGFAGGAERNIYDVATRLAARGHRSDLLYRQTCDNGLERFRDALDNAFERPDDPHEAAEQTGQILRDHRPDVVYFHRAEPDEPLAPLIRAVPSVRMIHDLDPVCLRRHKYFPLSGQICDRPLSWRCIVPCLGFVERRHGLLPIGIRSYRKQKARLKANHRFNRIIVASRYMQQTLILNGFAEERIATIPLSVADMPDQADPVADGSDQIIFVATLVRSKGVDLFLEMLTRLKQPYHATIIGDGHQRTRFEALAEKLGLADRVTFTGWLPRGEVDERLRQARMLVVSPRWPEPFNLVGLEAMAQRRPVVGFAVGGIPDWLTDGESGFLAPPQDLETMAQRVDQLLADLDLSRTLGDQGRETVLSQFRFSTYLDRLEQVLLEASQIDVTAASGHDLG